MAASGGEDRDTLRPVGPAGASLHARRARQRTYRGGFVATITASAVTQGIQVAERSEQPRVTPP